MQFAAPDVQLPHPSRALPKDSKKCRPLPPMLPDSAMAHERLNEECCCWVPLSVHQGLKACVILAILTCRPLSFQAFNVLLAHAIADMLNLLSPCCPCWRRPGPCPAERFVNLAVRNCDRPGSHWLFSDSMWALEEVKTKSVGKRHVTSHDRMNKLRTVMTTRLVGC